MFGSKLASVLLKWEREGGDLAHDLYELGDYPIKKKADARVICRALRSGRLDKQEKGTYITSPLRALVALFQYVDSEKAHAELSKEGLPLLRDLLRQRMAKADEDEAEVLLFILKILAMYRHPKDIDLIIEAARIPLRPDAYMWSVIFGQVDHKHPAWRILYDGLRNPLPDDFMCVAYFDFVNGHAIRSSLTDHPFTSPEGIAKLRLWLSDPNEQNFSYAHSATAALPFVPEGPRKELLDLASGHEDRGVRMEAAWAMAKLGDENSLRQLIHWCLDVNVSRTACAYLEELGHQDLIPSECRQPDFEAMAEMCIWLAHPQEFGRPPEKIELYDKRELYWPPTEDRRPVWLFKYTYPPSEGEEEPDIGIGMVGSVTFALFGESTKDLSPEDVYALHCCWELHWNKDPRAPDERTPENGRKILVKKNKGFD